MASTENNSDIAEALVISTESVISNIQEELRMRIADCYASETFANNKSKT